MLPFLQPEKMVSCIIAKYKDGATKPIKEEGEHSPEIKQAAADLIRALVSKDANQVAEAITKAYQANKMEGL